MEKKESLLEKLIRIRNRNLALVEIIYYKNSQFILGSFPNFFLALMQDKFIFELLVTRKNFQNAFYLLKYSSFFRFEFLIDLTVQDITFKKRFFALRYLLRSLIFNRDFRLLLFLKEEKP